MLRKQSKVLVCLAILSIAQNSTALLKCPTPATQLKLNDSQLACSEDDYCCQDDSKSALYCCSNCRLSVNGSDCNQFTYWAYVGYALGTLVGLCVLFGLGCSLAKLVRGRCCQHRSSSVGAAAAVSAAAANDSRTTGARASQSEAPTSSYPAPLPLPPPRFPCQQDGWLERLPKKPPEYYEIFSANPPPPYTESAL